MSYELLSGHPWGGGWLSEFKTNTRAIGMSWPQAGCMIGFRRHDQLVASLYKQYLHEGHTGEPHVLFSSDGSGLISPADLCFQRRIDIVEQHFSEVFVYTQEEMKYNFSNFFRRFAQFLGAIRIEPDVISRSEKMSV